MSKNIICGITIILWVAYIISISSYWDTDLADSFLDFNKEGVEGSLFEREINREKVPADIINEFRIGMVKAYLLSIAFILTCVFVLLKKRWGLLLLFLISLGHMYFKGIDRYLLDTLPTDFILHSNYTLWETAGFPISMFMRMYLLPMWSLILFVMALWWIKNFKS